MQEPTISETGKSNDLVSDEGDLTGLSYPAGSRQELEFRTVLTMTRTVRAWTRAVERDLRDRTSQTRVRWETLFAIASAGGPTNASHIARRMGVTWPAMVRNLDGLEADGLILRRADPSDNRSRLIQLTDQGREVIAEVRATLDPARSRLLSVMNDEELGQLIALVGRIRERLQEGDEA